MKYPFLGWFNYATIHNDVVTDETIKRYICIKTKGENNGSNVVNIECDFRVALAMINNSDLLLVINPPTIQYKKKIVCMVNNV